MPYYDDNHLVTKDYVDWLKLQLKPKAESLQSYMTWLWFKGEVYLSVIWVAKKARLI